MPALTSDQIELLQRACEGVPMWGGSTLIPRLARDVQLLHALGMLAPAADSPYRLTARGAHVLDTLGTSDCLQLKP